MKYRVFTRNWWKRNPCCPGGREPEPGRKHTIRIVASIEEARSMCEAHNATHKPGFLSNKAEFESI